MKLAEFSQNFFIIIDLEGNYKTCRFWDCSQNDNEFQG